MPPTWVVRLYATHMGCEAKGKLYATHMQRLATPNEAHLHCGVEDLQDVVLEGGRDLRVIG